MHPPPPSRRSAKPPPSRLCIWLGDSEETQAVSIFTRIASFDNPSKDVYYPFQAVGTKSALVSESSREPQRDRGLRGQKLSLTRFELSEQQCWGVKHHHFTH